MTCKICNSTTTEEIYVGDIRAGKFGNLIKEAVISRCNNCGVDRLGEKYCAPLEDYENENYWNTVDDAEVSAFYKSHDQLQQFNLEAIWPFSLRDLVVADIGCGAGSFLDSIANIASRKIAIEPSRIFHEHLKKNGYEVFPYSNDATETIQNNIDYAVSFQVIEHVLDPVEFLSEIKKLLKSDGKLLISTPNRDDILMKIHPEQFSAFFYRKVHRWYFDANSLEYCAIKAGYKVEKTKFIHRYGMANTLNWLKNNKPTGWDKIEGVDEHADNLWKTYLEASGYSDTIYLLLSPSSV